MTPAVRIGPWLGRGVSAWCVAGSAGWRWSGQYRRTPPDPRRSRARAHRQDPRRPAPRPTAGARGRPHEQPGADRRLGTRGDGGPDVQRGGQPRPGSSDGCVRPSPTCTCSWSTTTRPTAPASWPTSWRRPTRSQVLHRTEKGGLGAAYKHGFQVALEAGYDVIGEMDADGSHQPEQLQRLLDALVDADLVIGSRWVPGGSVVNWPRRREALSRGGNLYVRTLLGVPVRDATAGYRLFRRTRPGGDRPRLRAEHRLRLPDRHGGALPAPGPAGPRGADRVRRAGARRLQDEWPGRRRVAGAGSPRGGSASAASSSRRVPVMSRS